MTLGSNWLSYNVDLMKQVSEMNPNYPDNIFMLEQHYTTVDGGSTGLLLVQRNRWRDIRYKPETQMFYTL